MQFDDYVTAADNESRFSREKEAALKARTKVRADRLSILV